MSNRRVGVVLAGLYVVFLLSVYFIFSSPCYVSISFDLERDPPTINRGQISFKGVENTPMILDVLERHNVRGTFFVTGRVVDLYPGIVEEIYRRGHEVAVHGGYYHDSPIRTLPKGEQRGVILDTVTRIEKVSGRRPLGYRAPGHLIGRDTILVLEELGFVYDSSVVPSVLGKLLYDHALSSPDFPYHPSSENPFTVGEMRLKEIPLTCVFLNGNLDTLLAYQGEIITKLELLLAVFRCKVARKPLVVYLHPGLMVDLPNESQKYRYGEYLIRKFDGILYFLDGLNVKYITLEEIAVEFQ